MGGLGLRIRQGAWGAPRPMFFYSAHTAKLGFGGLKGWACVLLRCTQAE